MEKFKKASQGENELAKRAEIEDEQMEGVAGGSAYMIYKNIVDTCDAPKSTQEMLVTYISPDFWDMGTCPYYHYDGIHTKPEGITNCPSCTHYHHTEN